uniref:Uncharacterized protein n=1 Tax=Oryza brachyantha TaxID=4533 RepID=J3N2C9_ORYBR
MAAGLDASEKEDAGGGTTLSPGTLSSGWWSPALKHASTSSAGTNRLAMLLTLDRSEPPTFAEAASPRPGSVGVVASPTASEDARKQQPGVRR